MKAGQKLSGLMLVLALAGPGAPRTSGAAEDYWPDDGWMRCLESTNGTVVWQRFVREMEGPSPAIAYDRVFKSYESRAGMDCWAALPATDPERDGELIWSHIIPEADRTGAAVADGKVLQVTWYDKLYCYDALTNRVTVLWTNSPVDQPANQLGSAPSIANGLIFVGDGNGVRALRPVGKNLPPGLSAAVVSVSGLRASFSASGEDIDGTIASYLWRFGEGATSTAQNPTHLYDRGDNYTASVRVTDNQGAENEVSLFVNVEPNRPWRMDVCRETGGVRLTWEGGAEPLQFLERRFDLADSNTLWQTIWTNGQPVPPAASFWEKIGTDAKRYYRLRVE